MATTASGFWYPEKGTPINGISGLFAQQAASAENALGSRILRDGVPKFIDEADRDATFAAQPPIKGVLIYLESEDNYFKWTGSTWVRLIEEPPPPIPEAVGVVRVTGTNNYFATAPVTFPSGLFSTTPLVMTTAVLGTGTITSVLISAATGVTSAGFTMRVQTAQGTNFSQAYNFGWRAIQY